MGKHEGGKVSNDEKECIPTSINLLFGNYTGQIFSSGKSGLIFIFRHGWQINASKWLKTLITIRGRAPKLKIFPSICIYSLQRPFHTKGHRGMCKFNVNPPGMRTDSILNHGQRVHFISQCTTCEINLGHCERIMLLPHSRLEFNWNSLWVPIPDVYLHLCNQFEFAPVRKCIKVNN